LEMREELKQLFGELLENDRITKDALNRRLTTGPIIACGDETARKVFELGFVLDMAVIDYKTKRDRAIAKDSLPLKGAKVIEVRNPPATVTEELEGAIRSSLEDYRPGRSNRTVVLAVDGEEDLAFLPLVLYSPLGAKVLYGQPDVGLVIATVDEALKVRVQDIYDRMTITR